MKLKQFAALGIGLLLTMTACSGGGAGPSTSSAASSAGGASSSAADAPAPPAEDVSIGVAMPTKTLQRWINDGDAVKASLEADGYTVDLQYANDDIPTQTQQIDQMITNGVDVLIIAAIDGTALTSQLESAAAAGIKVIAYDRLLNSTPNVDFYVTFDNYNVGASQAQSLLTGLGLLDAAGEPAANAPAGPFNIELFAGSSDDNNATFFFGGAMDTLNPFIEAGTLVVKSGQTEFAQVATMGWSQEGAQKRMENLLTGSYGGNGEGLSAVLAQNDAIARGVITALQSVGMGPTLAQGLPVVTGQDAEIASVKLINDDVQYASIFKDTRKLADKAAEAADLFVKGQTPEPNDTETYNNGVKLVPSYLFTVDILTKDNIKSMLIDSGYYTEAQVEAGVV
jgi:putative multiple sugar transport system substrate-binding protein